ncbi:MAG: ABC transporter ATP-binding protein [Desulfobacteraceae bacterium]|nr:MAG: ABC transporter ATP-binding protein [Desulfobacteraceae bacterium]
MLQVNSIEVVYMNVIQVLRGLSLEVRESSIIALLGNNGAGKTTTLKAVSGLLRTEEGKVTYGTIVFDGLRIDRYDPEDIASMGITQIMEGRRVLEHLTVRENLMVGAYSRKVKADVVKSLDIIFTYFPSLKRLSSRSSGFLSGGEQQMLVVGRALMSRPRLMLLDEASLGLAPLVVDEIYRVIKTINLEQKTAILLVEQNANVALEVAEYGYVMENGKVVLEGPSDKLKDNQDVQEFYMGLSKAGKKSYRNVKHYKRRKRWLG